MGTTDTGLTNAIFVAMEQWTAEQREFVFSRGRDIPWPARSPDLSVCDYFLWGDGGDLTSEVYLMRPRDIDEFNL